MKRTHGMSGTCEYKIWKGIKKRCLNSAYVEFYNYGGRGITVCPEWVASFEAFLADVGPRPTPEHSIERRDNSRGYEPGNCVWATPAAQSRNTRRTRLLTFNGETLPMKDWAERRGIGYTTLANRLNRSGWTVEEALTR
jgi:hypothetical protein